MGEPRYGLFKMRRNYALVEYVGGIAAKGMVIDSPLSSSAKSDISIMSCGKVKFGGMPMDIDMLRSLYGGGCRNVAEFGDDGSLISADIDELSDECFARYVDARQ